MQFLTSNWFVKLASLAFMGFLFVTLIGPILSILATLACFAAIGYVGWTVLGWYWNPDDAAEKPQETVGQSPSASPPVAAPSTPSPQPQRLHWVGERMRWLSKVAVEAISGAAAGALLGLIAAWSSSERWTTVACGALIGASLGILVGNATSRASNDAASPQANSTS